MRLFRGLAAVMGGVLLLSAAGCNSAGNKSADTKGADTKKTVTLECFSLKPETVSIMEEINADFMKENPGIEVVHTSVADARTVLMTRISTNDMPDIFNVFPAEERYYQLFDDGLIVDLSDQDFMKNVSDNMLKMSLHNDRQYSLPATLSVYGIYYRMDIFEKLGIEEPKTYDELLEASKTLKENGYDAFALPNKTAENIAQRMERTIGVFDNKANVEFEKVAGGEMDAKDIKSVRAYAQFCVDIAPYSTSDSLGLDYESAISDFVNGKAAMFFGVTSVLSTIQDANPDIAVKMMPIPSPLSDEVKVPVNIDTAYVISASCPHPEEAKLYLSYLARPEVAQKYATVDGNISMIKGVEYDKEPIMDMKELMDNDQMFLTQGNFWPSGLREEMHAGAQQLFADLDVDAFVSSFGEAIQKKYSE